MIDPIFEKINRFMREIMEQLEQDILNDSNEFGGYSGFKMYWDSSMLEPEIQRFGKNASTVNNHTADSNMIGGTVEDIIEPLVDVFENPEEGTIEVYVHLPGVTSIEDVAITPAENIVKLEAVTPTKKFKKTIELNASVDSDYDAELNNGVLSLVFKKKKD